MRIIVSNPGARLHAQAIETLDELAKDHQSGLDLRVATNALFLLPRYTHSSGTARENIVYRWAALRGYYVTTP